jgi:hypothetical protein
MRKYRHIVFWVAVLCCFVDSVVGLICLNTKGFEDQATSFFWYAMVCAAAACLNAYVSHYEEKAPPR